MTEQCWKTVLLCICLLRLIMSDYQCSSPCSAGLGVPGELVGLDEAVLGLITCVSPESLTQTLLGLLGDLMVPSVKGINLFPKRKNKARYLMYIKTSKAVSRGWCQALLVVIRSSGHKLKHKRLHLSMSCYVLWNIKLVSPAWLCPLPAHPPPVWSLVRQRDKGKQN